MDNSNNQPEEPDDELTTSLGTIISLLDSIRKDSCKITLTNQFDKTKQIQLDLVEFKNTFDIDRLNQSHLIANRIKNVNTNLKYSNNYLTTLSSVLRCLLPTIKKELIYRNLAEKISMSATSRRASIDYDLFVVTPETRNQKTLDDGPKNGSSSSLSDLDFDFFFRSEIQPVLYVSSILVLFTIVFALIMLLSYRYNRQNAELMESKMFLKGWKNYWARSNQEETSAKRGKFFSRFFSRRKSTPTVSESDKKVIPILKIENCDENVMSKRARDSAKTVQFRIENLDRIDVEGDVEEDNGIRYIVDMV